MISLRVLGPIEATVDGESAPPELLWRKHLALLVYLVRSPKLLRTREHLVGVFWPEKTESAARHSLSEALRVIRRSLGEGALDTGPGQIKLAEGLVEVDVDQLEAWMARGDSAAAAALVAGEFMEGFAIGDAPAFEEWLTDERRRWRERGVEVLLEQASTLLATGRSTDAAELARRALGLDRLSETASRARMRALAVGGDRSGALEEYDRLRAALRAGLETEPSRDTRDLAERVRAERIYRAAAAPGGPTAASRRAPMVGREADLRAIVACWDRPVSSPPSASLAILEGEAGMGKSRLVDEFLSRVRLDGATTARVRAVEGDGANAGYGILGLAREGLLTSPGLPAAHPEAIAAFAALLPEWADRFGRPPEGRAPMPLGAALSEVVAAIARERPIVVAVDDAHWLDGVSILALGALLRDLAQRSVLVVLTVSPEYRRPEIDDLRVRLSGDLPGVARRLKPLSAADVRRLCEWALPGYSPIDLERVARRVGADSAGVPFLVVELLHAIAAGLVLAPSGAAWPAPFRTLDHSLPGDLPDTVVSAILLSFRRLSKPAQQVAVVAALGSERTTRDSLVATAELAEASLDQALDELEWQRWLESDTRGYSFVAGIARRVIAHHLVTPGQRRRIQSRLATT
jgi:DNA-binding SARP family transcriptional activator